MIALAVMAIGCYLVFRGHTESLIPLYALGVFIPFSLALFSLILLHWGTQKMIVPMLAFLFTSTVVIVLLSTKLLVVWPVFIFIPMIIIICRKIYSHYMHVQHLLENVKDSDPVHEQLVILPISGVHQLTKEALSIARLQHCHEIIAIYIGSSRQQVIEIKQQWQQFAPDIRLVAIVSSKQQLLKPLLRTILKIRCLANKRSQHLVVAIPQLTLTKRWHNVLHNHHAFALKQALLHYQDICVLTISYKIK